MKEYRRLDEVCFLNMGQSPDSITYNYNGNGLPFFQGNADFGEICPSIRIWCDTPIKIVEFGTLLISVRAPIGALNFVFEKSCIGRGLAGITPQENIDIKYIYYCLKSKHTELNTKGTGSTFKSITKIALAETKVRWIPFSEQLKIVKILDKLSELIIYRKQQLSALDELIKARFVEMFGNITVANENSVKLGDICTTIGGGTPTTSKPDYYNGNIPWISTVSLGPNFIDGTNAKGYITEEAIKNSATHLIPKDSIMVGTRVGVGKCSVNTVDMCTNQDINSVILKDKTCFNPLFIKFVIDQYQDYFDSIKKGATILGINTNNLKEIFVPDVSISEQNLFVSFVKQVDKSKFAVQKALNEAQ